MIMKWNHFQFQVFDATCRSSGPTSKLGNQETEMGEETGRKLRRFHQGKSWYLGDGGLNLTKSEFKQQKLSGCWFGTFLFFHTLGIIIPSDFHIFQRGWTHQSVIKNEASINIGLTNKMMDYPRKLLKPRHNHQTMSWFQGNAAGLCFPHKFFPFNQWNLGSSISRSWYQTWVECGATQL